MRPRRGRLRRAGRLRSINVGGNTLTRVVPQNVDDHTVGLAMTTSQPCNELVEHMTGHGPLQFQFTNPPAYPAHPIIPEYNVARALLAVPPPPGVAYPATTHVPVSPGAKSFADPVTLRVG